YGSAVGSFDIFESANASGVPGAGSARLTILSGGNVGIGVTNPSAKLTVLSNSPNVFKGTNATVADSATVWNSAHTGLQIANESDTAGTAAGIEFYNGSAYHAAAGIMSLEESTTLSALAFYTGGTSAGTPPNV